MIKIAKHGPCTTMQNSRWCNVEHKDSVREPLQRVKSNTHLVSNVEQRPGGGTAAISWQTPWQITSNK